jgi:diguanylate cyclase (GGDEF)-like protein
MKRAMVHGGTMRLSLLGRFSAMGVVVVAALGLAVGWTLKRQIEHRALVRAEETAQVMAQVGVDPRMTAEELRTPLAPHLVMELDGMTRALRDRGVRRIKIYDRSGHIAYSDDTSQMGRDESASPKVKAALAGRVVGDLEHGTDDDEHGEQLLEVYAPLVLGGANAGVFEAYLSYAPVAEAIREDVLSVYLLLGVGLAILFGALFRIVQGASRRLRHQALHDALTGLPNRALLYRRVRRAASGVLRGESLAALLLIDLDRFKEVNDTLGHDHGDRLLVDVSARLRAALRRGDTLARLGGDEFAVLLVDIPDRAAVAELAGRLREALRRPFDLGGVAVELDASIGVALCPDHGADVGTLVQRADVAMYHAKESRQGIETYEASRDPYSADRLALLAELRRGLTSGQLLLHYQPKVAVGSGEVVGVEALVRWQHPERGMLGPDKFVPLAERTGMIAELTRWVLDTALAQCREWRESGIDMTVAVNLAAANIVDAALPETVAAALRRHRVPGERLECEISEHTVMADPRRAVEILSRLRALGVRLSLDDFGTGHSSLAYLKSLPLDEVKIDRTFVLGMAEDEEDAVIVRSTIDLARNLGLAVVAEGVESEAVLRGLAELRCDIAQGFLLSGPLPADELRAWLLARRVAVRAPVA